MWLLTYIIKITTSNSGLCDAFTLTINEIGNLIKDNILWLTLLYQKQYWVLDLRVIAECQTKVTFLMQTYACGNHVQKKCNMNCGLLQTQTSILY